jgi:hypothetical protein
MASSETGGYERNNYKINEKWTLIGMFLLLVAPILVPNIISSTDTPLKKTFWSTSNTRSPGGYAIRSTHSITITSPCVGEEEPFDLLELVKLVVEVRKSEPLESEGLRLLLQILRSEMWCEYSFIFLI